MIKSQVMQLPGDPEYDGTGYDTELDDDDRQPHSQSDSDSDSEEPSA